MDSHLAAYIDAGARVMQANTGFMQATFALHISLFSKLIVEPMVALLPPSPGHRAVMGVTHSQFGSRQVIVVRFRG